MLLNLFAGTDLVSKDEARWLWETFAWSLEHFGREIFFEETVLVVPDNAHFPGRADSPAGMAALIFDHVLGYAGMRHWPLRLQDQIACQVAPPSRLQITGALRGSKGVPPKGGDPASVLAVSYDPDLVRNPEALIASYAHTLAHYLAQTADEPPPGGVQYWPQATEVVALFLGFGLMFANSAFSVPARSCGGCGGSQAQRRSYLTQYESTYALAIFCELKGISASTATAHLKKHLRPFFRKSLKRVQGRRGAFGI